MDPDRFLSELPTLFDEFPLSVEPRDPRFAQILTEVEGLATPNTLALVNHAVSQLGTGESYVEVGTFRGASLIAALLDNEDKDAIAIDRFSMGGATPARLAANLDRFGLRQVPTLLVGDAFELVRAGALGGRAVGVWYYDAAHDYASQIEGLRMVEPYLVPGALLIVDDTDWERVSSAVDDYLAAQPRARRVVALAGKDKGSPQWWEGMQVLAWEG